MTSAGSASNDSALVASVLPLVPAWRVDRTFDYLVPAGLGSRVGRGSLVRVSFGNRTVRGVVLRVDARPPASAELLPIKAVVLDRPIAPEPLDGLAHWIAQRYVVPSARAFERLVPPRVRVRVAEPTTPHGGVPPETATTYAGGRELVDAIEGGGGGVWCVQVLPGDDRARLVQELVSAAGRARAGAALVAVPEIEHGSAELDSLADVCADVARVDSARPDAERAAAWLRMAGGHWLAGGGRSTVLTPAPSVRLVVVADEHHPTYKEDRAPRYDARRVAVERARLQGAACVLMSVTPSVETGAAALAGGFRLVRPRREMQRSRRPIVEVFDPDPDRAVSHALHDRIKDALRSSQRVALVVPRGGYARAVWCASCRRSLRCPRCEAGLFFERAPDRVRCIRCDLRSPAPERCPSCGAHDFRYVGIGSERLAEQITRAFPRASVARADPESGIGVAARPADIYVTTWIGTKRSVRPPASLVAMLEADVLLRRPDFRAPESAYQAFAELAEWAGPASAGGRLVIESAAPAHHSIQAVARADYRFFLERELHHRKELNYPPYSELVKVTAADPGARARIGQAAEVCRGTGARVLGPVPVRTGWKEGGQALEILVKCDDALSVARALRDILASSHSGLRVDVDPH